MFEQLKEGDAMLVIDTHGQSTRYRYTSANRLTKSMIVTPIGRFRRTDGKLIGYRDHFGGITISELTDDMRKYIETKKENEARWNAIRNVFWSANPAISSEKITAVYNILFSK